MSDNKKNGIDTYNHIIEEIARQDKTYTTMKIGRYFATGLLKLKVSDIGEEFVSIMWKKGLKYFDNNKLLGHTVIIDSQNQSDEIDFS